MTYWAMRISAPGSTVANWMPMAIRPIRLPGQARDLARADLAGQVVSGEVGPIRGANNGEALAPKATRRAFSKNCSEAAHAALDEVGMADFAGFEGTKTEAAKKVGELIAEKAKAAGITAVVFDRGGNKYTGRVAAVADGAREGGLAL